MKRSSFLKNIAAVAVGLVAAPKLLKAEPEKLKFNVEVLQKRKDELDNLFFPDMAIQGPNEKHTLYFSKVTTIKLRDVLLDENERGYFVTSIDRINFPAERIGIMEINQTQRVAPKHARRRKRLPRPAIGKQYLRFSSAINEG